MAEDLTPNLGQQPGNPAPSSVDQMHAAMEATAQSIAQSIDNMPERLFIKMWGELLLEAKRLGLDTTAERFTVTPHDLTMCFVLAQIPTEASMPVVAALRKLVALKAEGKLNDSGLVLVATGNKPLIA